MMTRKDYKAFATIIQETRAHYITDAVLPNEEITDALIERVITHIETRLVQLFILDNPRFDSTRFHAASAYD